MMPEHELLEIQRLDVKADQLRHRRANLEERSALVDAEAEQAGQQIEIDELGARRVEVLTRQKRFEDEAQIVAARADADDARLYGGEVSAMKDLQALQDEIAGLRRRQGDLEDQAIVAMEEGEDLAARVSELETARAAIDATVTGLRSAIDVAEADIDGQLATLEEQRTAVAAEVDTALLAEYDRLRAGFGSATVVRFAGGKCVGCPSTMPAMEVDRMKRAPAGSVQHCDECGRIVIL